MIEFLLTPFCSGRKDRRIACPFNNPAFLAHRKTARNTTRQCWFFAFPTHENTNPTPPPTPHTVVSFDGHRQKVFNLMPATWPGNLSYEHRLHSQKTLRHSGTNSIHKKKKQKGRTDAAQIEKPRMPIFMLGTMRAINKNRGLDRDKKPKIPQTTCACLCVLVCVTVCVPVCNQ